jgi:hypothetical protein
MLSPSFLKSPVSSKDTAVSIIIAITVMLIYMQKENQLTTTKIKIMKNYTISLRPVLLQCCMFFISTTLFCSCSHVYYSPNSSNVPLFKEKGETRINGYYSLGSAGLDEIKGAEIQAAYAAGKNFGIMVNTAFMGASDGSGVEGDAGHGSLVEAGAGYFKPISHNYVFETYAGIGSGSVTNEYSTGGSSKVHFTKLFVQPSIGYSVKNFDIGLASKLSFVNMKISHADFSDPDDYFKTFDIENIKANPNSILWEPSLFLRVGFKTIKAQFQYTPSV